MSDPILNHGDVFLANGTEFEVVTISSNSETGEHRYEVITVADAEKRRKAEKKSADAERKAAQAQLKEKDGSRG